MNRLEKPTVTVVHSLPGRLRLRLSRVPSDRQQLESFLREHPLTSHCVLGTLLVLTAIGCGASSDSSQSLPVSPPKMKCSCSFRST